MSENYDGPGWANFENGRIADDEYLVDVRETGDGAVLETGVPYPQAYDRYALAAADFQPWPPVVTCGACGLEFPNTAAPSPRCPNEYDHPAPDPIDDDDDDEAEAEAGDVPSLFKTKIVIWSGYSGDKLELSSLAFQAEAGDARCTVYHSEYVKNPARDPDWYPEEDDDNEDDENSADEDGEEGGAETAAITGDVPPLDKTELVLLVPQVITGGSQLEGRRGRPEAPAELERRQSGAHARAQEP